MVFIKEFVSEHSKAPAWTPIARSEPDMVMRIKNDIDLSTRRMGPPDARKSSGQPPPQEQPSTQGSNNRQPKPPVVSRSNHQAKWIESALSRDLRVSHRKRMALCYGGTKHAVSLDTRLRMVPFTLLRCCLRASRASLTTRGHQPPRCPS